MSYSTQSDKFGVPVPKQDHVTSITQGRADTGFLPGVGAHYTSKLKIETYWPLCVTVTPAPQIP